MKSDCLRQVYLHSNDARLAATELARRLAATELARRAMKQHRHLPKTLVRLIASGLDPWVGTTEEVRVNYLPKGSDPDDSRIMRDFGPENRALRLLRAIADVHPHQFGTAYIARSPAAAGGSNLKRPASWRSDGGKPIHRTDLIVLHGTMAEITDQKFAINCNPAKSEKQEADNA